MPLQMEAMLNQEKDINIFWEAYLSTLPPKHVHRFLPIPEAWSFGYGEGMANRLSQLVVQGIETATCSRYVGRNVLDDAGLSIILDGRDAPLCIIETYEITIRPYRDIDAEWAKAEGEGDLSLEYWRKGHWRFFSGEAEKEGYTVSEDMPLSCERFRVLYPSSNKSNKAWR